MEACNTVQQDSIVFPYRKIFSGYLKFSFRLAEVQWIETETQQFIIENGTLHCDYMAIAISSQTKIRKYKKESKEEPKAHVEQV